MKNIFPLLAAIMLVANTACSRHNEPTTHADIIGQWQLAEPNDQYQSFEWTFADDLSYTMRYELADGTSSSERGEYSYSAAYAKLDLIDFRGNSTGTTVRWDNDDRTLMTIFSITFRKVSSQQ